MTDRNDEYFMKISRANIIGDKLIKQTLQTHQLNEKADTGNIVETMF